MHARILVPFFIVILFLCSSSAVSRDLPKFMEKKALFRRWFFKKLVPFHAKFARRVLKNSQKFSGPTHSYSKVLYNYLAIKCFLIVIIGIGLRIKYIISLISYHLSTVITSVAVTVEYM